MKFTARWTAALYFAIAGFLLQPEAGWAQGDGTRIHSSAEKGLIVNGWEMILPEIVEEDDGRMWIRYRLPNGGYESFPFQVGDPLTVKWTRSGMSSIEDYPAGWSVEDTEAIVDWHMNGGRGDYIIDGGEWTETDPLPTPTSPTATPSTAATSGGSDDDCSGPFCDRPISDVQSVSTARDPDRDIPSPPADGDPIRALGEQVKAANRRCSEARKGNDRAAIAAACQEAERLTREYEQKLGGG